MKTLNIADREEEQHESQRDHDGPAEDERGPSRAARPPRVVRADGMPHAHRAGRCEAERHHEDDADDVERDLVRGGGDRVQPGGQRRRQREHADLERDLRRGRRAKRHERAKPVDIERERDVRMRRTAAPMFAADRDVKKGGHVHPRDAR